MSFCFWPLTEPESVESTDLEERTEPGPAVDFSVCERSLQQVSRFPLQRWYGQSWILTQ